MRRFVAVLLLCTLASVLAQSPHASPLDVNGDPLPAGAIARLGTPRFLLPAGDQAGRGNLHFRVFRTGPVIALAPDGKILATVTHDDKAGHCVHLLDTASGQSLRRLDLPNLRADQLRFTPDGKYLLVSGGTGFKWVDPATGKVVRSADIAKARESSLALSADGKLLAAQPQKYVYDAPVGIWDTTTGQEVVSLPGRGASCKELTFSPDGKRLLLWSIVPTEATANGMSFGPESKAALACIDIGTRKIVGHAMIGSAQFAALGPDGETVALETADPPGIRVRHLPTGAERCLIAVKASQFAFMPDGKALVSIDATGRGALWDAAKGNKIRDLEGALVNKDFHFVGVSRDGGTIAVLDGGWDSAALVRVWHAATGKQVGRPPGHEGAVTCLAYAPGGQFLASGSLDKSVRLWNPATGEQVRILAVHPEALTAVAISPDAKRVASASQAGVIRVSNLADAKIVANFTGPARGAKALAFSHDGTVLFAGGHSPEVLAWRIADTKEILRLKTGTDGDVMAFGDGGALALTANGEIRAEGTPERLQIWRPATKLPAAAISINDEQGGDVRCEAAIFSPAGQLLASSQISTYEGIRPSYGAAQLRVWERVSGQPIRTLAPAITPMLAFSPDGRLLAAGGAGKSGHLRVGYGPGIDVWDILTGQKAGALPITPQCVAFSPNGSRLATGGWDHSVLIWEAPKVQPLNKAPAPSAADRDAWWTALGGEAREAYPAIAQLLAVPQDTVALLKERVRPVRSGDPATVAKLIAQLDSQNFNERVEAQEALEKMGEGAAHLLIKALEGNVSLELRRRLEDILRKCDSTSRLAMQHHRTVATLEWIGTPAARDLLKTLSDGAPRARLTLEAQAALKRLKG